MEQLIIASNTSLFVLEPSETRLFPEPLGNHFQMLTDMKVCRVAWKQTNSLFNHAVGRGFALLIKPVAGADPILIDDWADRESRTAWEEFWSQYIPSCLTTTEPIASFIFLFMSVCFCASFNKSLEKMWLRYNLCNFNPEKCFSNVQAAVCRYGALCCWGSFTFSS